jgi:lipopolysaccharide biosynthesis glycosyltransferase
MAASKKKINRVAFTIDASYAPHLQATLTSLLQNNNAEYFVIYLISFSVTKEIKRIASLKSRFLNVDFKFIEVNKDVVKGFKISGHGSATNYIRIFLPELIPEADDVLYIDADTIVTSNIYELLDLDLGEFAVAAVPHANAEREAALNIPAGKYFNSGVMKINLKYWRQNAITEHLINFSRNNHSKIEYWDQDALNAVLSKTFLKLPSKWNCIDPLLKPNELPLFDIRIIHYAGVHKPWNPHSEHLLKHEYFKYQRLSKMPNVVTSFLKGIFNRHNNAEQSK